jgi:exodeoxyribonuclease V alpha subunit
VRAGIAYALTEAMDDGHCGLPAEDLISLTQTLLEVPAALVETALGLELEGGTVIADDLDGLLCVFLTGLYRAELEIAERLNGFEIYLPQTHCMPPLPPDQPGPDAPLPWPEAAVIIIALSLLGWSVIEIILRLGVVG